MLPFTAVPVHHVRNCSVSNSHSVVPGATAPRCFLYSLPSPKKSVERSHAFAFSRNSARSIDHLVSATFLIQSEWTVGWSFGLPGWSTTTNPFASILRVGDSVERITVSWQPQVEGEGFFYFPVENVR